MDAKIVKEVTSAKYLGIKINEKLQWAEHTSNITKNITKRLG